MKIESNSIDQYLETIPEKWKNSIEKLRETVKEHLPSGFEETLNYGMIGFVVPKSIYPKGYHAKKKLYSWFVEMYEKNQ